MTYSTTITCTCGKDYPHHTHQGPTNYCPFCGRESHTLSMQRYYDSMLAKRRAVKGRRIYLPVRTLR